MFGPMSTLGCVVLRTDTVGRPRDCFGTVSHAGLIFFEYPRPTAWLGFACDDHASDLIASRLLLDRDRAELGRRRHARAEAAAAGAHDVEPEPLAVGANARRLADRAREWERRRGERERGAG
jgi:hypothetical protein